MWIQYQDEEGPLATPDDAIREFAVNVGRDRAEQAWLLTSYDTWVRNPFYCGPAVRHPEDDYFDYYEDEGDDVPRGTVEEDEGDDVPRGTSEDEDIPF